MSQIDFGGAVFPAMAGFFLFGKRAKVQEIQQEKAEQLPALVSNATNGLTSVSRYLLAAPVVTSVAKYVKKSEMQRMSGVAKYVLRQSIAEKNAPEASSVSKYVAKIAKEPEAPKKSGVERYLVKQEREKRNAPTLTGVAKYEANQNLLARKKAAAELVKKYREAEEEAVRLAKEAAIEAAYEATKTMIAEDQLNQIEETVPATRVGLYLQQQEASVKNTKTTGVSKYLAKQIIIDSQKPALSKVAKYLQSQSLSAGKKPNLTGVAKYLSKQHTSVKLSVVKEKVVPPSRVSLYIASQEEIEKNKPILSGVSRYLEKQVKYAIDNSITENALPTAEQEIISAEIEKCLEGEFIPANEFTSSGPTGVSRYLEKQGNVVNITKETPKEKVTGVSRYLDKQVEPVKEKLAVIPLTGVDRYMLNKAS